MRYKVCFSLIEAILWEFDLMGFKFKDQYYFDKCLPMDAAVLYSNLFPLPYIGLFKISPAVTIFYIT
jgi:hypothetical protein